MRSNEYFTLACWHLLIQYPCGVVLIFAALILLAVLLIRIIRPWYPIGQCLIWILRTTAGLVAGIGFAFVAAKGFIGWDVDHNPVPVLWALAGLAIIGFWPTITEVISSRKIVIGPERVELGEPSGGLSRAEAGSVRDNFLYLGKYYRGLRKSREAKAEDAKKEWSLAYEHYSAAHRLKKSILSAFRCAECLAHLAAQQEAGEATRRMMHYYDEALWLAERAPFSELENRYALVEWVRERAKNRFQDKFRETLAKDLRERPPA